MTPSETMAMIVDLRQVGKMSEAASHFADDGCLVLEPGKNAVGRAAVQEGLIALSKIFSFFEITDRFVIETGSIALHHSRWAGRGTGPNGEPIEASGITADVLQKQPDGTWKVVIDNPWGGTVLG